MHRDAPRFWRPGLLLVVALLLPAATVQAQWVPHPQDDPFYSVPKQKKLRHLRNGKVLDARRVTATAVSVPMPTDAWQVKYRSTDVHGKPTATLTTIMVPKSPWTGTGKRPLISYQTAEDGVGLHCAPSYQIRAGLQSPSNSTLETPIMLAALLRGYAVAAPDYEGPRSEFLGARGEGKMTLDGLRAALRFKRVGFGNRTPLGMWGYSGGAFATSIAAQIQRRYAPKLKLSGIALGGVVAELKETILAFNGSAFGGALFVGFNGVQRSYPKQNVIGYLNAEGKAAAKATEDDCIDEAAAKYPFASLDRYATDPGVIDTPKVTRFLHRISPLGVRGKPTAPVYAYHSVLDELAPIGPARKLYRRYCRAGVPVKLHEDLLSEHLVLVATGWPAALENLGERFRGQPAPNNCDHAIRRQTAAPARPPQP